MTPRLPFSSLSFGRLILLTSVSLATIAGCAATKRDVLPSDGDAGPVTGDFAPTEPPADVDPYANDPAPKWCGPAGGPAAPKAPTGTEACPSDKNKPGCACDSVGEKAACWTGLRKSRNLGVCKDGVATCTQLSENVRGWGPCEGQVLPAKGATEGKEACACFSQGQWKIDNPTPCVFSYPNGSAALVSTFTDPVTGKVSCPNYPPGVGFPPPTPVAPWSTSSLTVDCAGEFELCYELKAGDVANPSPSDCSLVKLCQNVTYPTSDVVQPLAALPPWIASDGACIAKLRQKGGYGEMTVKGTSVRCDTIDDGAGSPRMFQRLGYCPERCIDSPSLPECKTCTAKGLDGTF